MRLLAFLVGLLCTVPSWALDVEVLFVRTDADCARYGCGAGSGNSPANAIENSALLYSAVDGTPGRVDPGDMVVYLQRVDDDVGFITADRKNATSFITPGADITGDPLSCTLFSGDGTLWGYRARASLDGENSTTRGIDSGTANNAYWCIFSLELKRFTSNGILSQGTYSDVTNWWIQGVWSHDNRGANAHGMDFRGTGLRLMLSVFENTGNDTFYGEGSSFHIAFNQFLWPSLDGTDGDGIQIDKSAADTWIHHNLFKTRIDAKQGVFISTTETGNGYGRIDDNDCYGPSATATVHTCFFVKNAGGNRWFFRRNYGERSRYLIFCGNDAASDTKCTAIGNIGLRLASFGIQGGTNTSDHEFKQNSIFDAPICIATNGATGTSVIQNNALRKCATAAIRKNAGDAESYNAVFGSGDFVQNITTPTTPGTGAVTADPLWQSSAPDGPGDVCLQPGSPLFAAGTPLGVSATGYGAQDLGAVPVIGARAACDLRRASIQRRQAGSRRAVPERRAAPERRAL